MKEHSKFLSLVLRHNPDKIKLQLDRNGWANVGDLLAKLPFNLTILELEELVSSNDKQRFSFNEEKTKIRANQGHSIESVDLELKVQQPPEILYHGTVLQFIGSIKHKGLVKMKRQHVHLSQNKDTALKVGSRRGAPIILSIKADEMFNKGIPFYKSKNGVWLTYEVPVEYIIFND